VSKVTKVGQGQPKLFWCNNSSTPTKPPTPPLCDGGCRSDSVGNQHLFSFKSLQ